MRTLVDIPASELEALNALSKAEGVFRAESIRRAIKAYVEANRPPAIHEGFGLWKDYGIAIGTRLNPNPRSEAFSMKPCGATFQS